MDHQGGQNGRQAAPPEKRGLGGFPRQPSLPAGLPATPETPAGYAARIAALQEYLPRIQAVIRRIVHNESDVQELSQDVIVIALEKLPTFRGDASIGTWLHRIAYNAALMFRRKRMSQARKEERRAVEDVLESQKATSPAFRGTPTPEVISDRRETRKVLHRAIAELPEMYQRVLRLADIEDKSNEEIGRKLGLSVAAVKSRLHRARKMVRDKIVGHVEIEEGVV
jgi:RNA polymerase sigma-70 factor (ECF subfamily)